MTDVGVGTAAGGTLSLEAALVRFGATAQPGAELCTALVAALRRAEDALDRDLPPAAAAATATAALQEEGDLSELPAVASSVIVLGATTRSNFGAPLRSTTQRCQRALAVGARAAQLVRQAFAPAQFWDAAFSASCVGATLAGAQVLGLDERATTSALAIAATQASWLRVDDRAVRALAQQRAAAAAIEAVLVAAHGLVGPGEPLTGERGLFALHGLGHAADVIAGGLGRGWQDGLLDELGQLS